MMTALLGVAGRRPRDAAHGAAGADRRRAGPDGRGESEDGAQAAQLAERVQPDVVVTDRSMEVMDGLAATAANTARLSGTTVLGLTMLDEEQYVLKVLAAGICSSTRPRPSGCDRNWVPRHTGASCSTAAQPKWHMSPATTVNDLADSVSAARIATPHWVSG
jgi:CheY-like chemotaxis protein